ncbi:spermine synthase 1 [Volvox africanus]|uniref:thermospermine synthase n=1 Tax=Volvox africanus TaxID=51714 RepID=A0ABQ5RZ25_9CHLO|nr:spermine synthase 1 [Volvox africanus]
MSAYAKRLWLEEDLGDDYRWSYRVSAVLFSGRSSYQEVDLVETPTWGKVLLLDGKMQSTEADEQVYHELLVHPPLLHHTNPKRVYIMGGGEGATAREVLRHRSVEEVVMVDIDKVVTDICSEHLERNISAFRDPRLRLINDDARLQLEAAADASFDVIISDLADPLDGGPCYQLYTQEFYRTVVMRKLAPGGIFIAQSGPAGFLSCREVFTSINATLRSVFPSVIPYVQHIPSFCDAWGYTMAFTDPTQVPLSAELMDTRIEDRIDHLPLRFLDGETFTGLRQLNKVVRTALTNETEIYTVATARFIHGAGVNCRAAA